MRVLRDHDVEDRRALRDLDAWIAHASFVLGLAAVPVEIVEQLEAAIVEIEPVVRRRPLAAIARGNSAVDARGSHRPKATLLLIKRPSPASCRSVYHELARTPDR